ncbi:cobalamin B12-binding domain-containing protein [Streptomyces sp. IB2014 016-6]|uniref:cobalamin B12-binding domain-containing protein n=1 Tax=Streptomyces sp. IB2014 016-6 TaxID=2517818 RepID=UPI0011C9464C|nr:cobalamin B12-binding domain-containing protein [Streptomyces sp. IB2014 016-6]TXL88119.1 cobalamin B12-binding domain-containing protein [Streptomyces sp. IB2014 016-6]
MSTSPQHPVPARPTPFGEAELRGAVEKLWQAVSRGDEYAAYGVVLGAHGAGADDESLLLDVIGTVQRKVGEEWAANRMSVAMEHAATAVNDRMIAALAARHAPDPALGRPGRVTGQDGPGRITVACVDGEWHALPARLLAEVLRLRGWHVDYLGAQVPTPHLIAHVHRTGPDAVALSSSLATRLPTAHAAITACQAVGVPVLVGGAAFGEDGRYARLLGADAWAPDGRAAADLLARSPLKPPLTGHQPVDDLPHLVDQEYTMVRRDSSRLVKAALAGLEDRFPAVRSYTDRQRQHTAEDLGHIVDFLVVALYMDCEQLFTRFLTWTAGILTARGVPAASLTPTLDVLGTELKEFPRAGRLINHARQALDGSAVPAARSGSGVLR